MSQSPGAFTILTVVGERGNCGTRARLILYGTGIPITPRPAWGVTLSAES